ncbi:MAG: SUMF1/EgtB/PvdO family nonheme iron enzyme [Acidobacteriota bacterium]|nr:SUMF1/EgtB/PvdO family nonheme iron enzyme [Acidobacteriota bacterium]
MPREEGLRAELVQAREQTDLLFGLITPAALYSRPIADRHRLIFYLGHFDAFDWNLLARRGMGQAPFHPAFDALFERGIDPQPGEAPSDRASDWPKRDEVEKYNFRTREWIDGHLTQLDPLLLQMAIEHRYMHAETFAYLMHNLPYGEKASGDPPLTSVRPAPANPTVRIAASAVTLGKTSEGFGWDNEHLAHEVFVPEFGISKYKISNGEYLDFVREGGPAPNFWIRENGEWFYRGMFAAVPLPLACPVWVTWREASAFAARRGKALPTEAQFQLASARARPEAARDNFDFTCWDPVAVDAANGSGAAPSQTTGNGWEWTRDVFAPFEGFAAHPYYPGYSADFFDGEHYVMKGASPRTARLLTRATFRNWFRPEYPYMYAGFRLVEA